MRPTRRSADGKDREKLVVLGRSACPLEVGESHRAKGDDHRTNVHELLSPVAEEEDEAGIICVP